jgi:hypothetical protein
MKPVLHRAAPPLMEVKQKKRRVPSFNAVLFGVSLFILAASTYTMFFQQ